MDPTSSSRRSCSAGRSWVAVGLAASAPAEARALGVPLPARRVRPRDRARRAVTWIVSRPSASCEHARRWKPFGALTPAVIRASRTSRTCTRFTRVTSAKPGAKTARPLPRSVRGEHARGSLTGLRCPQCGSLGRATSTRGNGCDPRERVRRLGGWVRGRSMPLRASADDISQAAPALSRHRRPEGRNLAPWSAPGSDPGSREEQGLCCLELLAG